MSAAPNDLENRLSRWLIAALLAALGFAVSPFLSDFFSPSRLRQEGETRQMIADIRTTVIDVQADMASIKAENAETKRRLSALEHRRNRSAAP